MRNTQESNSLSIKSFTDRQQNYESAEMYEAYSRSLFKSLPTSKQKALNIAKSKAANAAREQTGQAKKDLGPAPQKIWVIAKDERAKPNSPRQSKPSEQRAI